MKDVEVLEVLEIETKTKENFVNVTLHTLKQNKQVLIFNNSKSSSEASAEKIARVMRDIKNKEILLDISNKILKILPTPTKQCKRLAFCIENGVAFHHSGLVSKQRELVEKAFMQGHIRVISSTPTLSAGLNLPAYKVIIKDYKRYSQRGYNDIPVLEFHQMSGRAGRPGFEDVGKAVLCVKSLDEIEKVVPKYIFGKSEKIYSKLAVEPILKMYLLSLITMDLINTKQEILSFFEKTLYGSQFDDLKALEFNLFRILDILKEYNFIYQEDNYYIATKLGRKISELYLNPDTADFFLKNIEKAFSLFNKKIIPKEDIYVLLQMICSVTEMKPLFRVKKSEEEIYIKKSEEIEEKLLIEYDPFSMDYVEFLNTLKTSDILLDWISEAPEDYISEKYSITPGELNYKTQRIDWLLYCLEELSGLKKQMFFKNIIKKLRLRFKYGIKEDAITLINIKGVGRVRARKLINSGFKTYNDLSHVSLKELSEVIGESTAIKLIQEVKNNNLISDIEENIKKPQELKIREVSSEEVNMLVENEILFEKEKKEEQKKLTNFFI